MAGTFYPAEPGALAAAVDEMLAAARPPILGYPPRALIAPHAGYVYSGPVAATGFAALVGHEAGIERVVVLGPSHFVPVRGLALPSQDGLATPLGTFAVWRQGRRTALGLPQVTVDDAAHAREHSLEVELPFLHRVLGEKEVLPLVVGEATPDSVAAVLDAVWREDDPATLLVVSSDLSHYLGYREAARRDRATCGEITRLGGPLRGDEACGARAINGLLVAARRRGLRSELLDLRSSGDTAGDKSRVVGYAAFAFG